MRPPFAIALAVLVIGFSFVKWWAGLAILGVLAAYYVWYKLGGW